MNKKWMLENKFSRLNAEDVDGLTDEELKAYSEDLSNDSLQKEKDLNKRIEDLSKDSETNKEEIATLKTQLSEVDADVIKTLLTQVKAQGLALAKQGTKTGLTESKLTTEIKENKETLIQLAKGSTEAKSVIVKADTLRASITGNQQALELTDIGQLAHAKLTAYDIFRKIPVSESNNNGTIRYYDWDQATIARAAAAVAEGAAFPESTAKWITNTITLQKIGDTLPVSEEFFEDEAMFAAELEMFLNTNVAIKRNGDIINADGTSNTITGIVSTIGDFVPAASGISDASIYDLFVKVSEAITVGGGSKYSPDFGLMNIVDINKMKLKKDANENYIIPPFVSREGDQVAGMVVLEENAIVANTMVIGDRRYARIYEKAGIMLSRGTVNAQFAEDMETLKARTRLAFLIRAADVSGFLNVTSISAALTTLATP